jgi:alkylation response protein AidB-like acyl-CoA dehydrogenase
VPALLKRPFNPSFAQGGSTLTDSSQLGTAIPSSGTSAMHTNVDDPQAARVRKDVRRWLAENWRPGLPGREWLARVVDARWATPRWPESWFGRGLAPELARVVEQEFARVEAPGAGQDVFNLWANTVLAHGSDDLRQRFLRRLLLGEVDLCLLYSEPGAGSDLASLQAKAERDGDEWVVNGQKVWTSGAAQADYAFLIARTDWEVPKHRGITFFFFPMKQSGVEVRPIRQITGDARFNEVFLTDARVPDANRIGPLNEGWWVLQTALAYERAVMGESLRVERAPRHHRDDAHAADAGTQPRTSAWDIPVPDLSLVELVRARGRADDAVIRQALAQLYCLRSVNTWNGMRARAEQAQGSPVASLAKLAMSRMLHTAGHLQGLLLGAEALLDGPSSPRAADANYSHLNAYFTSIGGGTDQIQRNIIAERILGLPREPDVDKGVPFRLQRTSPPVRRHV